MYIENGDNVYLGPSMLTDDDTKVIDRAILWMSVSLRNRRDGSNENLHFDETFVNSEAQIIIGAEDNGFRIEAVDQTIGAPIELFQNVIDSIYYSNDADEPYPMGEPGLGDREVVFEVGCCHVAEDLHTFAQDRQPVLLNFSCISVVYFSFLYDDGIQSLFPSLCSLPAM